MVSSFLALSSAALFAANALCVRWALRGATAATITLVSIVTNLVILWVAAGVSGSLAQAAQGPAVVFLVAGALSPAFARLTLYESINLIGVSRSAMISNTTPIFSAMLAVPLLGEQVTWRIGVGTLLVVLGLAVALRPEVASTARRPWVGVALALNTAIFASLSFILRKVGMRMLPLATLGSALTMTGALIALLPYVILRARRDVLRTDRGSLKYLIAAGVLSSGGFLAYFLALDGGDIVRVTPLANTTPLFALVFLHLFHSEHISPTTVLGALLVVGGMLFVLGG